MNELSDETRIQRGVRQGCVASPTLQFIHGKDFHYKHEGCQRGRQTLLQQSFFYADDTALLAGNEKELTELTSKMNEVGKQFVMKINIKKNKAQWLSARNQIQPK